MPGVYPERSSYSDSSLYYSQKPWPFLMQGKQKHKGGLSEPTPSSELDFSLILASYTSYALCPRLPVAHVVTLHKLEKGA